jgi:holo-[acyl-carrier protein] synthase
MILGTGIDIVEIERIAEAVKNPRFTERVFTEQEQEYCESRRAQRASSYAARFAAKEAVMKALGTGLSKGRWLDVEILSIPDGKPNVRLGGFFEAIAREMGVVAIQLSLSHSRDFAVAQAITWGGVKHESCDIG